MEGTTIDFANSSKLCLNLNCPELRVCNFDFLLFFLATYSTRNSECVTSVIPLVSLGVMSGSRLFLCVIMTSVPTRKTKMIKNQIL